ncbi:hypothetical protein LWF15_33045 [Kineosporia rhizophila]|nr:hypothetical protein [Kineosporia rhizophila]MCE0540331.1 hypothetical protein [Kineosporia rhizophila]
MPYNPALREHAANEVDEQRIAKGLTWRALAERLGKPPVWATAALLGSHPMTRDDAEKVASCWSSATRPCGRCSVSRTAPPTR